MPAVHHPRGQRLEKGAGSLPIGSRVLVQVLPRGKGQGRGRAVGSGANSPSGGGGGWTWPGAAAQHPSASFQTPPGSARLMCPDGLREVLPNRHTRARRAGSPGEQHGPGAHVGHGGFEQERGHPDRCPGAPPPPEALGRLRASGAAATSAGARSRGPATSPCRPEPAAGACAPSPDTRNKRPISSLLGRS